MHDIRQFPSGIIAMDGHCPMLIKHGEKTFLSRGGVQFVDLPYYGRGPIDAPEMVLISPL